ncbi:MAG: GGDEF domain-containing protein [Acidobacteriota bacterium]
MNDDDQDKTSTLTSAWTPLHMSGEGCLVQIYGGQLGRRFPITGELTIGREGSNTIVLDLDNVSRRHARCYPIDDQHCVIDLGSTNGTRVNGRPIRRETELRNGDLIQIGSAIFKFLSGGDIESLYHEEIYRLTIIDGLTQVHNKRYFLDFLEREMIRAQRHDRPLALILFDIDHFKRTNDENGHLAGDFVLRRLAERVAERVRREDLFARYGGEEFALVLTETTLHQAEPFAEEVRKRVEETGFTFDGVDLSATISLGIASSEERDEPLELIKLADDRLYEAKRAGRNRVQSGPPAREGGDAPDPSTR